MKTLQIPAEVRPSLLERLATLPEEEWLKLCNHPDQRRHWLALRGQFQMLETTLRAYFEGTSFPYAARLFWHCIEAATPEQGRYSPSSCHKALREFGKVDRLLNSEKELTEQELGSAI